MQIHTDQVISVKHSTAAEAEDRGKKMPIMFDAAVLVWVENTCFSSWLFVEAEAGQFQQRRIWTYLLM